MTSLLLTLLCSCGLAFALQNKLPDFVYRVSILRRLLECSFCTGFHAGWMAYLLVYQEFAVHQLVAHAFLSAYVFYWLDNHDG